MFQKMKHVLITIVLTPKFYLRFVQKKMNPIQLYRRLNKLSIPALLNFFQFCRTQRTQDFHHHHRLRGQDQ